MALSLLVAVAASMAFQTSSSLGPFEPPVSVEDVLSAWQGGDAGAAGSMAEAYLDYSVAYDGQLAREGAVLAFIAAIGSAMRDGSHSASYWMWVVQVHESVCGNLPTPYHEAADRVAARPGSSRETDRLIRQSAFRAASAAPCRDQSWPVEIPPSPEAPSTERAIGIFSGALERLPALVGATRIRNRVGVRLLFEYPSGSISPALDRNREHFFNMPRSYSLPARLEVLSPCGTTFFNLRSEEFRLCRADQPPPASQ